MFEFLECEFDEFITNDKNRIHDIKLKKIIIIIYHYINGSDVSTHIFKFVKGIWGANA